MICKNCKKPIDTTCELGDFGRTYFNTKDKDTYCEPCFDIKYPTLQKEKDNEESNDQT